MFVQSPEQGARGASIGSHCASHTCAGAQGNGHSRWSNGVKKVISKTLPTFFGAPGRQSFRNMATTGCGDSLKWQPKQGLSSHCDPCPLSEVRGLQLHMSRCWDWWVCKTLCCWQLYVWPKLQSFFPSLIYLLSLLLALFLLHQYLWNTETYVLTKICL